MAMIDEWGEEIGNIQDQGVFSETSLGGTEAPKQAAPPPTPGEAMSQGFPNTMPTQFPYAPTPDKVIHQVGPNQYGLYRGGGPQVRAAFPEQPIHPAAMQAMGCVCPGMGQVPSRVKQATAGMGDLYDDIIAGQSGGGGVDMDFGWSETGGGTSSGWGSGSSDPGWGSQPAQQQQPNWMTGLQAGFASLNAIGNAVGQGFDIAGRYQANQAQMEQASAMFDMQMDMMSTRMEEAQAAGEMDRYMELLTLQQQLEAAGAAAESSGSSTDIAALMALLQQSQQATRQGPSTALLVGGGVIVLLLGGGLIWALSRDKD